VIRINITDDQGTLLGQVELDLNDFNQNFATSSVKTWIGQKILDELPFDQEALTKLLST
jgi:hypothetical protein